MYSPVDITHKHNIPVPEDVQFRCYLPLRASYLTLNWAKARAPANPGALKEVRELRLKSIYSTALHFVDQKPPILQMAASGGQPYRVVNFSPANSGTKTHAPSRPHLVETGSGRQSSRKDHRPSPHSQHAAATASHHEDEQSLEFIEDEEQLNRARAERAFMATQQPQQPLPPQAAPVGRNPFPGPTSLAFVASPPKKESSPERVTPTMTDIGADSDEEVEEKIMFTGRRSVLTSPISDSRAAPEPKTQQQQGASQQTSHVPQASYGTHSKKVSPIGSRAISPSAPIGAERKLEQETASHHLGSVSSPVSLPFSSSSPFGSLGSFSPAPADMSISTSTNPAATPWIHTLPQFQPPFQQQQSQPSQRQQQQQQQLPPWLLQFSQSPMQPTESRETLNPHFNSSSSFPFPPFSYGGAAGGLQQPSSQARPQAQSYYPYPSSTSGQLSARVMAPPPGFSHVDVRPNANVAVPARE